MDKYLKNKKIKIKFKEDIEPQEVFLDSLAHKKEKELGISEKKFEVPLPKKILQFFYLFFLIIIFFFFIKTLNLQVLKGEDYSLLAKENKTRIELIRSERGVIYDRSMKQLVFNEPSFDLVLDKRDLPKNENEREEIIRKISEISKKNFDELKKEIEESESPKILVLENIPQEILISLETNSLPPFLKIERNTVRNYILGPTFSKILGYTGKISKEEWKLLKDYSISDYIGKTGLEKYYEEILRGKPGKIEIERDVFGNLKSERKISDPQTGKSLILWLDSELQKKIEKELKISLEKTGAKRAAAVALDPKTGGVLALVSLPSFDNNLLSKGKNSQEISEILNDPLNPLFNLAISGNFPTGSTIKPLVASAALQEKIISPEKKIYSGGKIEVPHRYNPEITYVFRDWKTHGWTDLRKAIANSVNVYFYSIGGGYKDQEGLGPSRIKKYLELFNWGKKTGIDLPGESQGLLPDPDWKKEVIKEPWWDGDTYNLSIGQGYLGITPLQVATAFSAIANGGKIFQPQIVQKMIDNQNGKIEELEPKVIRKDFIDRENLEIVREGMRQAVTSGLSTLLNDLPVQAAAKTGTAETGKKDIYHNWVTVFAPYDDPQIVLTIVIENVPKGQLVAQLPAKNILEWYFKQ